MQKPELRKLLAAAGLSMVVWAGCWYGVACAVQGIAPRWLQAAGFAAAGFFFMSWRRVRDKLSWLCRQETEMVDAAEYKGKLSALPTLEQSNAMRAMVMDPDLDEPMRAALQPLADYLEHMEKVRNAPKGS